MRQHIDAWCTPLFFKYIKNIRDRNTYNEIMKDVLCMNSNDHQIVDLLDVEHVDLLDAEHLIENVDEKHKTLYILELLEEKYYIGTTKRSIDIRFKEHFDGSDKGCDWTKKYKPICIITSFDIVDGAEEDIQTKKYMRMYGRDNVRGGSYTSIVLPNYQIMALDDEFCTADDLCFKCKKVGHISKFCYNGIIQNNEENYKYQFEKWNDIEEKKLIDEINNGMTFNEIALLHKRTVIAINARCKKLNIGEQSNNYHYKRFNKK
jgi:predicted GIY-YIG superfamily endonuclease